MSACVFCGEPGKSREHIISTVVQARAQISALEVEVGVRTDEGESEFRPGHALNQFVTRSVCTACNSGWMGTLENNFVDAVGELILPKWPDSDQEAIKRAIQKGDVVARWAAKTFITANLAGITRKPVPRVIASEIRMGTLPPRLFAQIAKIRKHEGIKSVLNRGFWFQTEDGMKWRGGETGLSFDAIFQINHLGIRAFHAPGVQIATNTEPNHFPISVLPPHPNDAANNYTFETFEDFESRLIVRFPPGCN